MNIPPDSFVAVIISGFGILLCLAVGIQLLVRKQGVKQSNVFLSLLLIAYSLTLFNQLMAMVGLYNAYQFLYFLPLVYTMSIGPLFYFYVKSRIQPAFTFTWKDMIHFILPLSEVGFYFAVGFRSMEFKSWLWQAVVSPYLQYVETGLTIIINMAYLVATLILLKQVLPTEKWKGPVVRWLRRFAYALISLIIIFSLYDISDWVLWSLFDYNLFNVPWMSFPLELSYAVISVYLGYSAFVHQNVSIITPVSESVSSSHGLEEQVHQLMEQEQVYLDPELSLEAMAKMLDIPRHEASKFFSGKKGSFRSFINNYRVNHFKSEIKAGNHESFSLLGLAFDSGFNSKASFNRIFKDITGTTPSQYVKEMS